MTVNTINIISGPYVGNGIADTFSYTFKVTSKTELTVVEEDDAGVFTELLVDSDFTVNTVGGPSGGTITRIAGPLPTGYKWHIRSNYRETQLTAFGSQGPFFPDIHEGAFDKLTYLVQQILEALGRTIMYPFYGGDFDAKGKRIKNLGNYEDPTDAVNAEDVVDILEQSSIFGGSSISETPPALPIRGQRWTDCTTMIAYIWTGSEWVEDHPSVGAFPPLSSVAETPTTIGLVAIVGGVGYLSVGTSSPMDWKQITN